MTATTAQVGTVGQVARRWPARAALLVLLVATGALYVWGLSGSGWANEYYAAAAQAGGESWKAWFYGSLDASNFITVDKPPASLWVMGLSVRLFGLSSWSLLLPQALEGIAAVALLYATVRRWFGAGAGLIAGGVLATTPVATLMFRYDNPDALLVLLLVAAVYATTRAVESGHTRWLLLAGGFVGFGFLTKMLQALIVVPALGAAYLVAGKPRLGKRVVQLLAALGAVVVSAGWYVAVVELVPASSRPYIGGSQSNSFLELTLGYNGFGRITGNQTGAVVPGGSPRAGAWGETGITRLFGAEMGAQASWLIPAALVALVALLWYAARSGRTHRSRAFVLMWGGWLLVTGAVFSFAAGIIHAYYTVALAPAIGALVGAGVVEAWRRRHGWAGAVALFAMVLLTAGWAWVLLGRAADWQPWLRYVVVALGLVAAVLVLAVPAVGRGLPARLGKRLGVAAVAAVLVTMLLAPAAYSVETVARNQSGAIPSAGPASAAGMGGGRMIGPGGPGDGGRAAKMRPGKSVIGQRPPGGLRFVEGQGGGAGGLLGGGRVNEELRSLLESGGSGYTWAAATRGANSAAGLQLASGRPVMALGGFNGTDPTPTLAQFQRLVDAGKVHYYVEGGGGPGDRSQGDAASIDKWVASNFTAKKVGGTTVYDLANPKSTG